MAKLVLNNITSGYASVEALNDNFTLIETALENTLSRDGTTPNTMSADLDMNGKKILNVSDTLIGGVGLAASVTAAASSASAASASASNAATSATNAANSASAAATSAVNSANSAAIVADWDYVGTWTTSTAYKKNNIVYVSIDGGSYIALVDHTSNATAFSTDLELGRWGKLAEKGAAGTGTGDMLKSENLSGLANYTTARSNMGLSIGTHVQAYDDTLTALAAVVNAADQINYATGPDAFSPTPLTAFARTLLDDADAATARATLGANDAANITTGDLAAARITTALNAAGTAPIYACRAWVKFDSAGTIFAAGNVASVTRNGVGDFTVNFATPMPDANYAVAASGKFDTGASNLDTPICGPYRGPGSAGSVRVVSILRSDTLSPYDCIEFNVAIFR